ncbi:MAG: pyrroline-5-carboxylate reductase [Actinomycetia bacterium]|nr:pyrroline-5-carboxylate reductase [Actinomycetes bacterium]
MAIQNNPGRVAVIGAGKMGSALLAGFLKCGLVDPRHAVVVEPGLTRRSELAREFPGVTCLAQVTQLELGAGDICLLAVHPETVTPVLQQLRDRLNGALLVSIAGGVTTDQLQAEVEEGTPVVRVMPNTPAMVGEAMSLLTPGTHVTKTALKSVVKLFESVGRACVVAEELQPAGTAVSGSGPAYFALVASALIRAGVMHGLPLALAVELTEQTMLGTARLLQESGMQPESLIDVVSSPGGTTAVALAELENAGLRAAFTNAVDAAVARTLKQGLDEDPDDATKA